MKDVIISWIVAENECIQNTSHQSDPALFSECYTRLLRHLHTLMHFNDDVNRYKLAYTMVSILDTPGLKPLYRAANKSDSSDLEKKNYILLLERLQYTISQAVLICVQGDMVGRKAVLPER